MLISYEESGWILSTCQAIRNNWSLSIIGFTRVARRPRIVLPTLAFRRTCWIAATAC